MKRSHFLKTLAIAAVTPSILKASQPENLTVKGVIVERGMPGDNGSVISLTGVNLPCNVPVTRDFSKSLHDYLGRADCYLEDGVIKADITFFKAIEHGYPAVGVVVNEKDKEGLIWAKTTLTELAICQTRNQDSGIKSV